MATITTLETFTAKNHPTISVELSKLTKRKSANVSAILRVPKVISQGTMF